MPYYPYRCDHCRADEDVLRSIGERDKVHVCTECSRVTRRIATATDNVRFAGGGDTRKSLRKFPVVPLRERMAAQYGDNE